MNRLLPVLLLAWSSPALATTIALDLTLLDAAVGTIPVDDFSIGVARAPLDPRGGSDTAPVDLVVTRPVDAISPLLMHQHLSGALASEITLTVTADSGQVTVWRLGNARISEIRQVTADGARSSEELTFAWETSLLEVTP